MLTTKTESEQPALQPENEIESAARMVALLWARKEIKKAMTRLKDGPDLCLIKQRKK